MNSPIKDALNDFINSNSAAVEKAMENGEEHDLAKSEPTIPDLVNYLSYHTPQPGSKDAQPMSLEDKVTMHDPNFIQPQQPQHQQHQQKVSPFDSGSSSQAEASAYHSPGHDHQQQQQLSQPGDGNHFGTSGESSFRAAAGGSSQAPGVSASSAASPQSQHQHQFLQQPHGHYGQNSTFYPSQHSPADVNGSSNINTSASAENMVFADIQGSVASVYAHNATAASNTSNLNSFNAQPSLTDQFQHSVQTQHHNPVDSFQNQAQVNSSSFQNNAVLPSSFTQSSSNTHLQFKTNPNSLSFEPGTIGDVEGVRDQFKSAEKMHVDEQVSGYTNPGNPTQNISHFQQQTFQTKSSSMDIGFNSDNYSGGNADFSLEQFDSSLVDKSASSVKDYGSKAKAVDTNVSHNAAGFELANNPYQTQPVTGGFEASQYTNQAFTQDASISHQNQQLSIGEFQAQASSSQNNVGLSLHAGQYVTTESAHVQPTSNQGQQGFGSNSEVPYHGTGYQEASPLGNSAPSPMTENFHVQPSNIENPHTPTYSNQNQIQTGSSAMEGQQYPSHITHQPSLAEEQQYTASPQSNSSKATLVLSPEYSAVAFQSNVSSPENFGGQFSSQQQQHEQPQQSVQHHQQHNFLNNVPQQQTSVLGNNDNFMTQNINDVAAQSPQLAANANLQYHSPSGNQGHVTDKSVKSSVIDTYAGSNNTQYSPQASFAPSADSFGQLDLESLAKEDYGVESSAPPDPLSQKNQSFNYQFSNTVSHPTSQAVAEGTQSNFPFQSEKSMLSGTDSQSFETACSRSAEQTSTFQAHSADLNLRSIPNVNQETQEKYPQPMQVQDSNRQLSYQAPTSRIGETEMDTSTGVADKTQNIPSGLSYEEIHLSIVEAGKEFSRKAADAGGFPQHKGFAGSGVQQNVGNSVSTSLGCHSSQANMFYQPDTHIPKTETIFASHTQPSTLTPVVSSSSFATQNPLNVNLQKISPGSNFSLPADHHLFSSLLSNIQTSSAAADPEHSAQIPSKLFSQRGSNEAAPIVTMPNFLENPGVMLSCIRTSNPENVSMLNPMSYNKPEQAGQVVMTMIAASPINSLPVVAKSGADHPKMAAISSQQQIQQPVLSLGSIVGINQQLINSHISFATSPIITSASTVAYPQAQQQHPISVDVFNQMNNQQSQAQLVQGPGLVGKRNDIVPAINRPNGAVFQVASSQGDSKVPGLTFGIQSNSSKPINHGAIQTIGGALPAGTTAVVGGQQSMSQPHIVITLEDLKKLLTQKNSGLSPTLSEPKPMEQSAPTVLSTAFSTAGVSSAPSLVLQSSASSCLRLVQPLTQSPTRLFLNNPPRFMHHHEQLQQTREKLQLVQQTTLQSQTGFSAHQNQEHTILFSIEESNNQKKAQHSVLAIQQDQQASQKLQMIQQMHIFEQQNQHIQEQLHRQQQQSQQNEQQQQQEQTLLSLNHTHNALQNMLFSKKDQASTDTKLPPLQLPCGQSVQKLVIQQNQLVQIADQKGGLKSSSSPRVLNLGQVQQELQVLKSVTAPAKEQDKKSSQPVTEKADRVDRLCSDSLKKDYKHLHSLLTMENSSAGPINRSSLSKAVAGQSGQTSEGALSPHMSITKSSSQSKSSPSATSTSNTASSAFNFTPLSAAPALSLSSSCSTFLPAAKEGFSFKATAGSFPPSTSGFTLSSHANSAPLTTLAFTNAHFSSAFTKVSEVKEPTEEASVSSNVLSSLSSPPRQDDDMKESEMATDDAADSTPRQGSILAQILTESKRSHTPLSVDLSSPGNSNSEPPSPLSSPNPYEDCNTQLTLVERSAGLHIKSDTMHGLDDDEGDDMFSDSLYKRPSTEESRAPGDTDTDVPMKIAKASTSMDARSSLPSTSSREPAFDIGSVVSSASNFSFAFGNKDDTGSEVFTFGSSASGSSTSDSHLLRRSPKPMAGKPVPTQSVRPTTRKQKEYSLKAYYPSKCEDMELKILQQPEVQHRARYQTEGSRGAIKDVSQQGFPVIKLNGYTKQTKLQIYIGDESIRVKPHGFYQACRVFGKNSTSCTEQEIEGTAVIEIDLTPENDMTAKLDCIGILKLRNADVERRIGPKRARDKKKNNTRARLVMRCLVERKSNRGEVMLQTVSNPIVCTQPVGQPEICRMSLTESSVEGGESLFIIGKNFKNKGTTVSFQMPDPNDDSVVLWQAGAEIEQEFFQPTHLICKIPPFSDATVQKPRPVHIVVSCAGKKSDPHKFTYLPVKQEIPMETDTVTSSRSLSFVSPEALQLNHLVHQSHALASGSSTIFQLPPGAVPTVETQTSSVLRAKPSSTQEAAPGLIKPARLLISNNATDASPALSWSPAAATSTASLSSQQVASSPFKLFGSSPGLVPVSQVPAGMPSFLLDEKPDGLVQEDLSQAKQGSPSHPQDASFNCIVHSTSRTQPIASPSHTVSSGHVDTVLTPSAHVSSMDTAAANTEASQSGASTPIVVFLNPSALQNSDGGEPIQNLLQQLLNSQNR